MSVSEKLAEIAENVSKVYEAGYAKSKKEITNELNEIIGIQESYIYPTIFFYFDETEYHLQESEAYWTDKISFKAEWSEEPIFIWNENEYAKWDYYTIVDSQNNLIKYNDAIKNLETYSTSGLIEFFIQCDDENKYVVKIETWGTGINVEYIDDSRFTPAKDESYRYLGCYFTPEENGKKYFIPAEYDFVNIGDTIYATLVEGGNE